MSTNVEEIIHVTPLIKERPRFRRGIKPTGLKDIYDCILWYYPNGINDSAVTTSSRRGDPKDVPWEVMEAEAVKDYWFPNWRTLSQEGIDKIQNDVISMIKETRCMWKSVFSV